MHKLKPSSPLAFIFLLLTAFACREKKEAVAEKTSAEIINTARSGTPKTTAPALRLKFTSGVRAILEDSHGNTWFGSDAEGACLLQNGRLRYFTTEHGLSNNQVRTIYEDKDGIVWFECGRGLSRYDGRGMTVYTQRDYHSPNDWSLTGSELWFKGNETDRYNELEKQPGVYQYDGKKLSYRRFPSELKSIAAISTPFVKSKDGTIWFGTYSAVIGYDGNTFKIINNEYLSTTENAKGLHVRSLMADSKGNLWIGNNGLGVYKYDGQKAIKLPQQQPASATVYSQFTKPNSLTRVFSIGEDTLGNIWFGTRESGVYRYDGNRLTNYTEQDGIESNHIWTIYRSKTGAMWFGGANPSGVYEFVDGAFKRKY
ncbi:ligand-binding sensor domain-containing protein [Solirubrum puertoriconensis]|nr:two-component regulator propeller domain-containing protein [Solirubrum puertoriconensis]